MLVTFNGRGSAGDYTQHVPVTTQVLNSEGQVISDVEPRFRIVYHTSANVGTSTRRLPHFYCFPNHSRSAFCVNNLSNVYQEAKTQVNVGLFSSDMVSIPTKRYCSCEVSKIQSSGVNSLVSIYPLPLGDKEYQKNSWTEKAGTGYRRVSDFFTSSRYMTSGSKTVVIDNKRQQLCMNPSVFQNGGFTYNSSGTYTFDGFSGFSYADMESRVLDGNYSTATNCSEFPIAIGGLLKTEDDVSNGKIAVRIRNENINTTKDSSNVEHCYMYHPEIYMLWSSSVFVQPYCFGVGVECFHSDNYLWEMAYQSTIAHSMEIRKLANGTDRIHYTINKDNYSSSTDKYTQASSFILGTDNRCSRIQYVGNWQDKYWYEAHILVGSAASYNTENYHLSPITREVWTRKKIPYAYYTFPYLRFEVKKKDDTECLEFPGNVPQGTVVRIHQYGLNFWGGRQTSMSTNFTNNQNNGWKIKV